MFLIALKCLIWCYLIWCDTCWLHSQHDFWWPLSPTPILARLRLCRFARHGPWPVQKWFSDSVGQNLADDGSLQPVLSVLLLVITAVSWHNWTLNSLGVSHLQVKRLNICLLLVCCRKRIASTHGDHTIRITSVETGKCSHVLEGHPRTPWCTAFHPSSSDILASGCLAGEVRIWDLKVITISIIVVILFSTWI